MMSKKYLTYPEVQKLVAEAVVETRYETVTFFGKQAVVCGVLLKNGGLILSHPVPCFVEGRWAEWNADMGCNETAHADCISQIESYEAYQAYSNMTGEADE